jgi:hypothetical protein
MASPLSQEIPSGYEFLIADLTRGPATAWVDPRLAELDFAGPQLASADAFNPAMTVGDPSAGDISSLDGPAALGSIRIPEPPSFISFGLGVAFLGILGLYRLNYRPRKRRSHRHMRPLTVLR